MNKVRNAGILLLLGHLINGGVSVYTFLKYDIEFMPPMLFSVIIWLVFAIGFYNLAIAGSDTTKSQSVKKIEETSPFMVKAGIAFVVIAIIAMLLYLSKL